MTHRLSFRALIGVLVAAALIAGGEWWLQQRSAPDEIASGAVSRTERTLETGPAAEVRSVSEVRERVGQVANVSKDKTNVLRQAVSALDDADVVLTQTANNGLGAYHAGDQIVIAPNDLTWSFGLRTAALSRDNVAQPADAMSVPAGDGSRVEIARNGMTEWLDNTANGLQHGWTIDSAPAGSGELVIAIDVVGATPSLKAGNPASLLVRGKDTFVALSTPGRGYVVNYHSLKAWDAEGRALPARFEVADARIRIHVDDADAVYPIVVDPNLDPVADWTVEGGSASLALGGGLDWDVRSGIATGDFNGDGNLDIALSSNTNNVYVHYGDGCAVNCFSATPDVTITEAGAIALRNVAAGNLGGGTNSGTGLVCEELVVADFSGFTGTLYAYEGCPGGAPTLNTAPFRSWNDPTGGSHLGRNLRVIDVSGDGLGDIVASAPRFANGQSDEGRLYAVFGNVALASMANLGVDYASAEPNAANFFLGAGNIEAIDWNQDGITDVVVGAYSSGNGQVRVYLGTGATLNTTPAWSVSGSPPDLFANDDITVGDFNNDGKPDFAVAARDTGAPTEYGEIRVFNQDCAPTPCLPDTTVDQSISGNSYVVTPNEARLGWVMAAGDFDNDGDDDLVSSAAWDGTNREGIGYIFWNTGSGLDTTPANVQSIELMNQTDAFQWLGGLVAVDVNQDGSEDLLAGTPRWDNALLDRGRADLFLGAGPHPVTVDVFGLVAGGDSAFITLQSPAGTTIDSLTPAADDTLTFTEGVPGGAAYAVTVEYDGSNGKNCTIGGNDTGTMTPGGVTGITIRCGYATQVSVDGLEGAETLGATLDVTGEAISENQSMSVGATIATFANVVTAQEGWSIAIGAAPGTKTCAAVSGSLGGNGLAADNDVIVRCGYTVTVAMNSASGFGDTATIQLVSPIGGPTIDSLVVSANGNATFGVPVLNGDDYEIVISDGVAGERCVQKNARGSISGANASTAAVNCGPAADVTVNYTDVAGADSLDINLTDDKADHTPQTTADGNAAVFQTIVGAAITIGHATLPVGDRCVFGGGSGDASTTLTGNYAVNLNCGVAADVTVTMNNIVNTNNDQDVDLSLSSNYTSFANRTVNNTSGAQTYQTIVADTIQAGWSNLSGGTGAVATTCSIKNQGNPTIVNDVVPSVVLTGNHNVTVTCGLPAAVNVSYEHKNGTAVQLTLTSNGKTNDYTDDIRYTGLPASGTKIVNIVAGTDFVVQGVGSQCTTQGNGTLTPTVTCGNEYNIQINAVNGLAGGEAVQLWLTSNLDDDAYQITFDQGTDPVPFTINQANGCVDPGNNPNPECYVVETANWAVAVGTGVPAGKSCAVTDASGTAGPFGGPFPALWPQAAPFPVVNCGTTRVITVHVATEPGNTVQANIVDSAGGSGSTSGLGNSGSTTFNVVDGATFTVTASNYSDLAGFCTVKDGTNITADADKDVYIYCGRPATVRAALSGTNANIAITSSATDPQFNANVAAGNYDLNVTVGTAYAVYATSTVGGNTCSVKNPTGTAADGINTANVTCGTARSVDINVSGLTSGNIDLTFASDVSENVTFMAVGNGTQSVLVPDGATFMVTYDDANADGGAAKCNILNGSGTVSGGNATVTIQCGTPITVTVNVANLDNAAEAVVVQMSDDTTTHTDQSVLNGNAAVFNTIAGANITISYDVSGINADTCVFGGGPTDADNNSAPLAGNYSVNLNCGVATTVTVNLGANLNNGADNVTVTLADDQTTHANQTAQTPGNGGADAVFNTIVGAKVDIGFDLAAITADRCLFANGESAASETLTGAKTETVTCGVGANVNVTVNNSFNTAGDQEVLFQLTDENGYTTYPESAEVDGSAVVLPTLVGTNIHLDWTGFNMGTFPLSSYCTIDQDGAPTRANGAAPSIAVAGNHNATITCGEAQTVSVQLNDNRAAFSPMTLRLTNNNGSVVAGANDWTDDLTLTGLSAGLHTFTVVKGQDYVVNGTGSICTVQNPSSASPTVTCGDEYTIAYTVNGDLGTNVPQLRLKLDSTLDSDSYTKLIAGLGASDLSTGCVDPGNNPNPNCYVVDGATYTVSVDQTPAGRYCAVTDSTGLATGAGPWPQTIGSTVVDCSAPYTIGGALVGLDLGESVTLRMVNDKSDVVATQTFSVNGQYNFSQNVVDGASYTVVLVTEPPAKNCVLENTTGTVSGADVINVNVTCRKPFTIVAPASNAIVGLSGTGLAFKEVTSGAEAAVDATNATYFFPEFILADGDPWRLAIQQQPRNPNQVCEFAGTASGVINGADAAGPPISCTTTQYGVTAQVSGLTNGMQVGLSLNGGATQSFGNGAADLGNLDHLATYNIAIASQPAGHTCAITSGGAGQVPEAGVQAVVSCSADPAYQISVNVTGLQGDRVRLVETSTGLVTNVVNGGPQNVTFPRLLTNGTYTVQVDAQPAGPGQICLFGNGQPATTVTINSAPITVALTCTNDTYTVGGTLVGLRPGASVSLTNNGADTIALNSNGAFQFPTQLIDGAAWHIEVSSQPANQSCVVAPRSGIVYAAAVSEAMVNCTHLDYDLDGLSDFEELTVYNTLTDSTDTDADAVTDYAEVMSAFTNPLTDDTDFDGVTDYTEFYVYNGPITTDPRIADTDGDGLSDGFELTWAGGAKNGDPDTFDANDLNPSVVDTDKGGIWDGAEVLATYLATDPLDRNDDPIDSDGDGISDWDEVNGVFCNATSEQDPDTDNDGLTDAQECLGYDSNPTSSDSDGDGIDDGAEVRVYATDLTDADSDSDGIGDGVEVLTWGTNPLTNDTDADGVTDYTEAYVFVGTINTNPLVADTDGDGLSDGFELTWAGGAKNGDPDAFDANDLSPVTVDTDNGGEWDGSEVKRTYPSAGDPLDRDDDLVDSDGDGIIDGAERLGTFCLGNAPTNENDPDSDNDGLTDGQECFTYNSNPNNADTDGDNLSDKQEVDVYNTDLLDSDTDNDTLTDGDEVLVHNTDPLRIDTDGDSIRDDEEVVNGSDGYTTDPRQADPDQDGLTDPEEVTNGTDGYITDPNDPDSDNDGLDDGREAELGTDPNDTDSDNDGLSDQREVELTDTNPLVADTDGDTLTDGDEVNNRSTDPLTRDTDHDGVRDDAEFTIGTSPVRADSDGDGLTDGFETSWNNGNKNGTPDSYDVGVDTNPLDVDTDDGGIWDGVEVLGGYLNTDPLDRDDDRFDADHDGIDDWDEVNGTLTDPTDPYDPDTDNDGIPDGTEVFAFGTSPVDTDSDDDRLSDHEEVMRWGTLPNVADTDGDGTIDGQEVLDEGTDPRRVDTDRDGLSDTEEITEGADGYLTDPLDADSDDDRINDGEEAARTTNPNDPDSDQDGLEDGEEVFRYNTDPDVFDTDGDGISDGDEVMIYGTDPLNADTDGDQDVDGDELAQDTNPLESDVDSVAGGGGGCSVAPQGQDTGAWILLLIPVWWLLRRRRHATAIVAVGALVLALPLSAAAQQFSVGPHNAQQFRSVEDGGSFLLTHDSRTLKQLGFNVQLAAHYGDDLLVVRNAGEVRRAILGSVVTYELGVALGIVDLLQVGLSVPYHGRVSYTKPDGSQHHTSSYMGDPQLSFKVRALNRDEKPVGLGFRTWLNMPLGAEDRFLGDDGVGAGVEAILDSDLDVIVIGLNLGYQHRPSFFSQGVELKDQLIASAAASVPLNDTISIFTDLNGATLTNDPFGNGPGDMLEFEGGLRLDTKYGASMRVGGGTGLGGGMGEAPLRLFATVSFRSRNDRDRDGDGIPDNTDDCPGRPEDVDGFKDEDGCPDLDDDEDGILNVDDQCPRAPEDRDGVRDEDGCPDEDNDQDGVDDVFDRCPDAKEVINNFQDGDGCPDRADAVISVHVVDEDGKPLEGSVLVKPGDKRWDIRNGVAEIAVENPTSFQLRIESPGYKPARREVTISNGQLVELEVVLTQKEKQ